MNPANRHPRRLLLWLGLGSVALLLGLTLWLFEAEKPTDSPPSQGFAGLGADTQGYEQANPGVTLSFPEDHAAHPDSRIEWWYLTANLQDASGTPLGIQWTLFRQALLPPEKRPDDPGPWATDQLWMAHAALSQGQEHRVAERFARGNSAALKQGQAGAQAIPFRVWMDDWQLASLVEASEENTFERLEVSAQESTPEGSFSYRLQLTAEGPLVLHGEEGFSRKAADGQGSMYYSQPFWRVEGEVTLDGTTRAVSGQGWLDREWSSQLLSPQQRGWDWFSLHLEDGHKLMAFQLRGGGEDGGDYRAGTWITPEGTSTALSSSELVMEPLVSSRVAGRDVPTQWRLQVSGRGLDLAIKAPFTDRWMATSVPYWEGEVNVTDYASDEVLGVGYLEMTGY
ncbi:iron ABC transporter permease [Halomonas sp. ZH2S]|uniref:Iron ABC transporter permease n=1 Tax=Vreelandella zhuhanensis TaxID=2684210 RepID=A0A7X3H3F4_9GAMM|nr:lipocalin-like domain-containing protein [Halomonas zhuhanensis]MWJ28928.1 iron ABC transporter permease [Halomonas zhuhanensis]